MLIHEIFSSGTKFKDFSKDDIESASLYVKKSATKEVSLENGNYSLKITPDDYYALCKGEEDTLVGWVRLDSRTISRKQFKTLRLIYILPEFKKTKAFLILLNAVRSEIKVPLLVDGAVFKDGEEALKSLSRREQFKVKVIDLDSGSEEEFNGTVPNDKSKGIVVEGFDFPLEEMYFAPGGKMIKQSFMFFD